MDLLCRIPPDDLVKEWDAKRIEIAKENNTILDIDAIYDNGKLFGRKLRTYEYNDWDEIARSGHFVVVEYKGEPHEIRLKINLKHLAIDLWTVEYSEKLGHHVSASFDIPFSKLYGQSKETANKIFEDAAKMIIESKRRNLGKYD